MILTIFSKIKDMVRQLFEKSTMILNSCHDNQTKDLKDISNTLQNLEFVPLRVDEIVGESAQSSLPLV